MTAKLSDDESCCVDGRDRSINDDAVGSGAKNEGKSREQEHVVSRSMLQSDDGNATGNKAPDGNGTSQQLMLHGINRTTEGKSSSDASLSGTPAAAPTKSVKIVSKTAGNNSCESAPSSMRGEGDFEGKSNEEDVGGNNGNGTVPGEGKQDRNEESSQLATRVNMTDLKGTGSGQACVDVHGEDRETSKGEQRQTADHSNQPVKHIKDQHKRVGSGQAYSGGDAKGSDLREQNHGVAATTQVMARARKAIATCTRVRTSTRRAQGRHPNNGELSDKRRIESDGEAGRCCSHGNDEDDDEDDDGAVGLSSRQIQAGSTRNLSAKPATKHGESSSEVAEVGKGDKGNWRER